MKVTYDIPDGTMVAFLNFVYYTDTGMVMAVKKATNSELKSGEILKFTEEIEEKE